MAKSNRTTAQREAATELQRITLIRDTLDAVREACPVGMDILAQVDEKRRFAELMNLPYLAVWLFDECEMIKIEDIDVFVEWMHSSRQQFRYLFPHEKPAETKGEG